MHLLPLSIGLDCSTPYTYNTEKQILSQKSYFSCHKNGWLMYQVFPVTCVNKFPFILLQLMSNTQRYAQFLFHLSDLGCSLQFPKLRDTARIVLKLMPADVHTVDVFRSICSEHVRSGGTGVSHLLEALFFNSSPTQVLYNIEVRMWWSFSLDGDIKNLWYTI